MVRTARGKSDGAVDQERDADSTGRFDFGALYGTGAVLGFTPRDIDGMTLAEFDACVEGWKRANGADEKPEPPSEATFEKMLAEAGG